MADHVPPAGAEPPSRNAGVLEQTNASKPACTFGALFTVIRTVSEPAHGLSLVVNHAFCTPTRAGMGEKTPVRPTPCPLQNPPAVERVKTLSWKLGELLHTEVSGVRMVTLGVPSTVMRLVKELPPMV